VVEAHGFKLGLRLVKAAAYGNTFALERWTAHVAGIISPTDNAVTLRS
jgi:hypothetical protein